jgi:hypothetical protein
MNRKQKRALRKQAGREVANRMEAVQTTISKMSNKCSACDSHFDKNDKSILDDWNISIDSEGKLNLTCQSCSAKKRQE